MVQFLEPQMSAPDRHVVGDIAIRRLLHANYREALSKGADGWVDDALAFRQAWGFDLAQIRSQVLLWHGSSDTFSPVEHTHWLRGQLVNAKVTVDIQPNAAHFTAVQVLPEILAWLRDPEPAPSTHGDSRDARGANSPGAKPVRAKTGAAR